MPAKKPSASSSPTKAKTGAGPKSPTKPKSPAKPKTPASVPYVLEMEEKGNPESLDRLYIPGMSEYVEGYDAGIPQWLFISGLTIQVDKNWQAKPGDIITVGRLLDGGAVEVFAMKTLAEGEENYNFYFFSVDRKFLPDGPHALVYVVHYSGGPDRERSYPLRVMVKTDLPAGEDNDQIEDGHSGLKFSVSESVIVPGNASSGVKITLQPYPNAHPGDSCIVHWGSSIITTPVVDPLKPTVITVTYQDIVDAGDSDRQIVWLEVLDLVGNISTPSSASVTVSVNLDVTRYDGPALLNAGPIGYVDLEVLNQQPLEVQMFTPSSIGRRGDIYDVIFRAYPPKGGVIVVHRFVPIETAGRPYSAFFDYLDVRAAAGGRIQVSFVLRRSTAPFEIYSKTTHADVRGSIVRLEAPEVEGYPNDQITDDPEHIVVNCPYYAWRQPNDKISLILRYVKSVNDIIVHIETRAVGQSWPAGAPVKRLIYREQLQRFKGYQPELYYVISGTGFTRARAVDLNESLRRALTIS